MPYQVDLYSTAHYIHRSAKSFMHVTEVLLSISLHLKYNKFMKFRKRKSKTRFCFPNSTKPKWASSMQKPYLCTYYIYIKGFY